MLYPPPSLSLPLFLSQSIDSFVLLITYSYLLHVFICPERSHVADGNQHPPERPAHRPEQQLRICDQFWRGAADNAVQVRQVRGVALRLSVGGTAGPAPRPPVQEPGGRDRVPRRSMQSHLRFRAERQPERELSRHGQCPRLGHDGGEFDT
jgi:hypothetical protein